MKLMEGTTQPAKSLRMSGAPGAGARFSRHFFSPTDAHEKTYDFYCLEIR